MYIESLGNPRHFSRLARRLTRAKPVVAVKAGRLPTSASALGADATEDALLRQTGVIRVPTPAGHARHRPPPDQPAAARRPSRRGASATPAARWPSPPTPCSTPGLELAELAPPTPRGPRRAGQPRGRVAGRRRPRAPRQRARRRARRSRSWSPTRASTPCSSCTPRPSAARAEEVQAALEAGRKARPEVPVVGVLLRPAARRRVRTTVRRPGADLRRRRRRRPRPRPGGRLRRVARAARGGAARPRRGAVAAAAVAGAGPPRRRGRPARRTRRHGRCSTPSACRPCPPRWCDSATRPSEPRRVDGLPRGAEGGGPRPHGQDRGGRLRHRPRGPGRAPRRPGRGWRSPSATRSSPRSCSRWSGPGVDVAVVVRDHPAVGPVLSLGPGGAAAALDTAADVRVLPLTDLEAVRLVAGSRLAPLLDDAGPTGPRGHPAAGGRAGRGGTRDRRARAQPGDRARRHRGDHPGRGRPSPPIERDPRPPVRRA